MEENKQEFNTVRRKAVDHCRPPLSLCTLSSPARSPRSSHESSFSPELGTSTTLSTEESTIEIAIGQTQSATPSADPHGLKMPAHDPFPHAKEQALPDLGEVQSAFDKLRVAMEDGDANLFGPLQVALGNLSSRIDRSLEVRTDLCRELHGSE